MGTNFNHEESLSLINEMINRARNNVQQERKYSILYWGYITSGLAILIYVLLHTLSNPYNSFWVWSLMIPAAIVSGFIDRHIKRKTLVKTHIDKIGDMVWKGYSMGAAVFLIVIFSAAFKNHTSDLFLLITPVILIMVGICEFATACIYRYKLWYWVAALFGVGAICCVFLRADLHMIVLAVCMVLGFVVPGHILIHQEKKSHV